MSISVFLVLSDHSPDDDFRQDENGVSLFTIVSLAIGKGCDSVFPLGRKVEI